MKCCAILGDKMLFWEHPNDGSYRSYFFENRGYRPVFRVGHGELSEYYFHEFLLEEVHREFCGIGKNPSLRGYNCDQFFEEEIKRIVDIAASMPKNISSIKYGVF